MKFLILFACLIAVSMAAPQKNPCSTVNGKTYCTGLITPDQAAQQNGDGAQKNPCTTVNGKTYCTGLVTPPPPPEPRRNPCTTVNGKTYCTGLIVPPGQGH